MKENNLVNIDRNSLGKIGKILNKSLNEAFKFYMEKGIYLTPISTSGYAGKSKNPLAIGILDRSEFLGKTQLLHIFTLNDVYKIDISACESDACYKEELREISVSLRKLADRLDLAVSRGERLEE